VKKTIDEVLAEAAIRDVQIRYCRAVDRKDFDLLRTCFHPDATLSFGIFEATAEEFIGIAGQMLATYTMTRHFTGNQLVEVNGNRAWAEHYTDATHRIAPDENGPLREFVTRVRYVDSLDCRDGDWRIVKRVCVLDLWHTDARTEEPGPDVQLGKRDRSDASYSLQLSPEPA